MLNSGELVGLIVFESHHLAFQTEVVLKRAKVSFPYKIVPAPRHLSLSCDYALELPSERLGEAKEILLSAGLTAGLEYYTV